MRDRFESEAPQARSPSFAPRDCVAGNYCVDLHSFTGTLHISSLRNDDTESAHETWEQRRERAFNSPLLSPRKRVAGDGFGGDRVGLSTKRMKSSTSISYDGHAEAKAQNSGDQNMRTDGENWSCESRGTIDSKKAVRFSMTSNEAGSSSSKLSTSNVGPTLPSRDKENDPLAGQDATLSIGSENSADPGGRNTSQNQHNPKGMKFFASPPMSFPSPPRDAMATSARASMKVLTRSSKHFLKQITLAGKDAYDVLHGDGVAPLNNGPNMKVGIHGIDEQNSRDDGDDRNEVYDAIDGTELHYACAADNLDHIMCLLEYDSVLDLHVADCGGKLPIHVFMENRELISKDPAGCEEVAFTMIQFMGPDKTLQALNSCGLAPFVSIIGAWTEWLHRAVRTSGNVTGVARSSTNNQSDEENQQLDTPATSSGRRRIAYRSLFRSSTTADRSLASSTDRAKFLYIPPSVTISNHVRWAIRILSRLIDEDYPPQIREAILTNMTFVPLFLKSLLLIKDADEMTELLESSLAKHVIVDKRSIGVWLCAMLTGSREAKVRAISFLKLLSRLTLHDLAAGSKSPDRYSDEEIARFAALHEGTFNAVYVMPGIVPAVLGLGDHAIEDLSTTRVMQYVTDRTIRKEGVFFVLICDFFYSIFLLMGYRLNVESVLKYGSIDGPEHYRDMHYISTSTMGIACYFLLKEVMTLLSLGLTSEKLAKRYCLSVFNVIDVAAVVLLLGIDSALSYEPSSLDNEGYAASITICLLWLKLMGAFKILNGAFALLMYGVKEVIR